LRARGSLHARDDYYLKKLRSLHRGGIDADQGPSAVRALILAASLGCANAANIAAFMAALRDDNLRQQAHR
jgi:hypothetical protein